MPAEEEAAAPKCLHLRLIYHGLDAALLHSSHRMGTRSGEAAGAGSWDGWE